MRKKTLMLGALVVVGLLVLHGLKGAPGDCGCDE